MKWFDGFWEALPELTTTQQATALTAITLVLLFLVGMLMLRNRAAHHREIWRRREDRDVRDNSEAILILQDQLGELRTEVHELRQHVDELMIKDAANNVLIQAHTAREQILSMALDAAVVIIKRLIEQLPPGSVTQDLRDQAARIMPARDLLRGVPLPGTK
jgi:hypothetical protein